ncbi:MAG: FAD-binding oxidoreductase [Candidatus Stygibacter frigidus]|nr:FAD-binding oxidoreductase [Candidatus Stygibacter frigidus]
MEIIKSKSKLAEYLHDESRLSGNAEYLVFARTAADIQEAVNYCLEHQLVLTIQGSRTGITGGSVPESGMILNLEKMNKITGIRKDTKGNYYLRCEPGLKLVELREVLNKRQYDTSIWVADDKVVWREFSRLGRYIFPPDPTESSASLGGMASCNASGARSYKYGAMRQWISQVKTINPQKPAQRIKPSEYQINLPDKDVKNAAGYYLREDSRDFDIYIGAEGTLAVITELEIKLISKPAHCWGVLQFFASESAAMDFCEGLKLLKYQASAIEYFDHNALMLLRGNRQLWQSLPDLQDNWKFAVYYEFEGDDAEILENAVFAAGDLAEEFGSQESDCWFVDTESGVEQLKEFRHAVPEAINKELDKIRMIDPRISKISTDLAVPAGCLGNILKLHRQAQEQGWRIIVFGHIGNDHLHTNILPSDYESWLAGKELVKSWAEAAVKLGGSVSGEHGIGKIKRDLLELMYGPEGLALFKNIKLQFDPQWLLNRGNIIERERVPGD